MNARHRLPIVAFAAVVLAQGCASGDGVPKAQVRNDTDLCMVEAAWFDDAENAPYGRGYYFMAPILKSGQTEDRSVVDGSGYAYAVFKQAGDCYAASREPGGEIWRTNAKVTMEPGKTTMIVFSEANAARLDTTGDPSEAAKEAWRFPRVSAK